MQQSPPVTPKAPVDQHPQVHADAAAVDATDDPGPAPPSWRSQDGSTAPAVPILPDDRWPDSMPKALFEYTGGRADPTGDYCLLDPGRWYRRQQDGDIAVLRQCPNCGHCQDFGKGILSNLRPGVECENCKVQKHNMQWKEVPAEAKLVLNGTRKLWRHSEDLTACDNCSGHFKATMSSTGKHHCRGCGNVLCGLCYAYSATRPAAYGSMPVTVCSTCFWPYAGQAVRVDVEFPGDDGPSAVCAAQALLLAWLLEARCPRARADSPLVTVSLVSHGHRAARRGSADGQTAGQQSQLVVYRREQPAQFRHPRDAEEVRIAGVLENWVSAGSGGAGAERAGLMQLIEQRIQLAGGRMLPPTANDSETDLPPLPITVRCSPEAAGCAHLLKDLLLSCFEPPGQQLRSSLDITVCAKSCFACPACGLPDGSPGGLAPGVTRRCGACGQLATVPQAGPSEQASPPQAPQGLFARAAAATSAVTTAASAWFTAAAAAGAHSWRPVTGVFRVEHRASCTEDDFPATVLGAPGLPTTPERLAILLRSVHLLRERHISSEEQKKPQRPFDGFYLEPCGHLAARGCPELAESKCPRCDESVMHQHTVRR